MAQSLIEQLQLGAVEGSSPITDLLRKAKLAAVKLSATEFAAWIDLAMNGYYGQKSVPSYRQVAGRVKFHNPIHGWRPVIGLNGFNQSIYQPIGEVASLSASANGFIMGPIPESLRRKVSDQAGFECEVMLQVATTAMASIVEAVRNHVLEWTLKLEQAGIRGDGLSFTQEETRVAHSMFVTNNYHGPVASVAHGSNTITGISQSNSSATPQQIAEAVGALIKAIQAQGKPSESAEEASDELAAAESELKAGGVPFGRISKALSLLQKGEDIALRAPQVLDHLQHLGKMLGLG